MTLKQMNIQSDNTVYLHFQKSSMLYNYYFCIECRGLIVRCLQNLNGDIDKNSIVQNVCHRLLAQKLGVSNFNEVDCNISFMNSEGNYEKLKDRTQPVKNT
eukprot:UN19102